MFRELAPPLFDRSEDVQDFAVTKTLDLISRRADISRNELFRIGGRCVVLAGARIRSDLQRVELGECCFVGRRCELIPPQVFIADDVKSVPQVIHSFSILEDDVVVRAAVVGRSTLVMRNAVLVAPPPLSLTPEGDRCVIGACCLVRPNAVLPPDTVVPPFAIVAGNPGTPCTPPRSNFQAAIVGATTEAFEAHLKLVRSAGGWG
jgi:carbonic anhydrase/acetyltransferase-like protein (isoleucine patch superfamily)